MPYCVNIDKFSDELVTSLAGVLEELTTTKKATSEVMERLAKWAVNPEKAKKIVHPNTVV